MGAKRKQHSALGVKPDWIDGSVALGVQADQFLHAYYYKQVKDGNRHSYEEFFARNAKNPELALQDALNWWHAADFDHSFEERMIYEWSPRLRELLARERILKLTEEEFVDAVSRVHAIRDHEIKQENEHLGLPDRPQAGDDKVEKFGEWLWRQRSREGRTVLELLNLRGYRLHVDREKGHAGPQGGKILEVQGRRGRRMGALRQGVGGIRFCGGPLIALGIGVSCSSGPTSREKEK